MMLGRQPISTLPICVQEPATAGAEIAFAVRDRSGSQFVVIDRSASILRAGPN